MRKFITTGALFLAVSLIPAALPAQAQSTPDSQSGAATDTKPAQSSSMANPEMTTVTGCVQAGRKAGTFRLVGDDGSMYMLRSKKTDFSQHVGHEVTVSGHVMTGEMHHGTGAANGSGDAAANGADSSASAGASGSDQNAASGTMAMKGHAWKGFAVKSMTMVSESCKTTK
ncbi:MAG TPA: hypothetical protein VGD60_05255 [Candidatus Acidoferrales bacterium]